jgi:hypothetical protein
LFQIIIIEFVTLWARIIFAERFFAIFFCAIEKLSGDSFAVGMCPHVAVDDVPLTLQPVLATTFLAFCEHFKTISIWFALFVELFRV